MRLKAVIKLIICLIILAGCVWVWQYIHKPGRFPISNVKVDGTYHYVSQDMLKEILLPEVAQGFFNINVDQLQNQLAMLPGIKAAGIRRSWPSTIHVRLVEYDVKAHWGNDALVTDHGIIFTPKVMINLENLPYFYSNNVHAELMLETYQKLNQIAQDNHLSIGELKFIANQWSVTLSNKLTIILGSTNPSKQLQKILAVLPEIQQDQKKIMRIDMRYTNGFAVKVDKK